MIQDSLRKIIQKQDLDEQEMAEVMTEIMSGEATEAQIGAVMAALATKGETFSELAGAARAMRRKATRVQVTAQTVVDTCGTGGDQAHTFNISTTAAFVVAGCGITVAKHGNRSISSQCGSADLLEALGLRLDVVPEVVEEAARLGPGPCETPRLGDDDRPRREGEDRQDEKDRLGRPAGAEKQLEKVAAAGFRHGLLRCASATGPSRSAGAR